MNNKIKCFECDGSGKVRCTTCEGIGRVTCPACGGKGKKYEKCPNCNNGYNIDPDDDRKIKCSKCNGTGKIISDVIECDQCGGSGKVPCECCTGSGDIECATCHGSGGVSIEEYCAEKISLSGKCSIHPSDEHEVEILAAADEGNGIAAYVASGICDEEDAAIDYARKSAEDGYKYGELYYGEILYGQANPECEKWFEKAADQGLYRASAYLTLINYFGLFGKKQDANAARQYARFSNIDDVKNQFGDGDINLRALFTMFEKAMQYEDYLVRKGKASRNREFFQTIWALAYKIIYQDFGADAFIQALTCAQRYGSKYMADVLGMCRDRDDVKIDDKLRKFISEYAEAGKNTKSKSSDDSGVTKKIEPKNKVMCASSKKRWKFVVLGLLFGWMGAHYMYAKRILLLLLLWASFIIGVVMFGSSQNDEKQAMQDASAEVAKKSSNNEAIGGVCIALWALLWLGGTFFVKNDGKGNRM